MKKLRLSGLLVMLAVLSLAGEENFPALAGVPVKGAEKIGGAVAFADGFLHAAGSRRYQIYDCRKDPLHPEKIAELKVNAHPLSRQIALHRGFAYVTARQHGLGVFDVRDVRHPKFCGNFDTAEMATGVAVSGNLLSIALRVYGIEFFDVSDPANPKELFRVPTQEAQSCFARGNLLAVGNWAGSYAQLFDVSDPGKPEELSRMALDGYGDGVYLSDRYLFAATGHHSRCYRHAKEATERKAGFGCGHGLEIFDVSDPRTPKKLSAVKFPRSYALGNDMWAVFPAGKLIGVADTWNGLFLVDVSKPAAPQIAGRFQLPVRKYPESVLRNSDFSFAETRKLLEIEGEAGKVTMHDPMLSAVSGNGVIYCCGASSGVWAVKVPQALPAPAVIPHPGKQFRTSFREVKGFTRLGFDGMVRGAAAGERLYVAAGRDGVWQLALKAGKISRQKVWSEYASAIASHSGMLAIGGKTALHFLHEERDGKLRPVSRLTLRTSPQIVHFYCDGKVVLVCGLGGSFELIDLRNPAKPESFRCFSITRAIYQDYFPESLLENLLPVNGRMDGLFWYRVEPGRAEFLTRRKGSYGDCSIAVFRDRYLMPKWNGVLLFAPENYGAAGLSAPPLKIGTWPGGLASWDGDNKVWFASRTRGQVSAVDFQNKPKLSGQWNFAPGTPGRVVFWQGRAVIPAGFGGLYIQQL